ncbi:hypothetical protein BT96DRAFT_37083 [Gymnopus androsaceus JB14]|uniref:URB1 N-terminal domain-containing protein n=1 Tax=Gymnopus androsaceus JB14 TaxID=1447944 RepID=A0A6A4HJX9_9AGAR|nr:hypothetical protein BT96DRAFT_37083 [Gymnopus androsaceus JB14]
MVISLLSTILRHQSSSSDSDNRLARSLLSTTRMSRLNAYLAGKRVGSSSNVGLVVETLNLLTALVAWDSKVVLETVRWDIDALHRILRYSRNRKDGKGKGKGKMKSHQSSDSRARIALMSLITAMLSQDVPARVKSAFLGAGTQTLILLQNILSGIGDSHEEEDYLYSYAQIKLLLETLYAGVWCDKRIPRTVKVAVFAFGHGHNENGKRGQVGGEKVWKGLLALYTRTELESSQSSLAEEDNDEEGIPADLVHHFLLALCTRPGQGVCFRDKGWYPSNYSDNTSYGEEHDDLDLDVKSRFNSNLPSFADEDTRSNSNKFPIHNPLLLRVLRLLTPSADPRQQELAARILEACPELVAACGDVISGGPGALDPRLNARWMVGMTWYGRVVGLAVPEEMLYLPTVGSTSGGITGRTPRVTPPPLRNVVESIVPSFSGGGTKTILSKALSSGGGAENTDAPAQESSSLGLVQHTAALTLCRCLGKFLQVRTTLLRAARAAGESEEHVELDDGTSTVGPWTRRLTEVTKEVRARMPDVQVVLAFLKHVEAAGSPSSSSTTSKPNPTAHALLSESAYRLVWLVSCLLRLCYHLGHR